MANALGKGKLKMFTIPFHKHRKLWMQSLRKTDLFSMVLN
jgi:hypothetical protein